MSKLDEIFFTESNVLPKYYDTLEKLRPLLKTKADELKIELAELVRNYWHYVCDIKTGKRTDVITIDNNEEFLELIKQINEAETGK